MPKTRREFSPEFKREAVAVALLESSGRPLMQSHAVDGLAAAVASGPGVGNHAIEA